MTQRRAVLTMLLATLLWSIAGVVSRHIEAARDFEVTFWRSAFNVLGLAALLSWLIGPASIWRSIRRGGWPLWVCALCWNVMFTAFMLALSLTTVANVLVTLALGPLLTALSARVFVGYRLPRRTLVAMGIAGTGIVWMYAAELGGGGLRHLLGVLVACTVPLAGAVHWTVVMHLGRRAAAQDFDLRPAILVGALISAATMLPFSLPFAASAHDLRLLGLLGVVQLSLPCLLAMAAARVLSGPHIALIGLLEIVFGVTWVWLGASEEPSRSVLVGGALVLAALAMDAALALRAAARAGPVGQGVERVGVDLG